MLKKKYKDSKREMRLFPPPIEETCLSLKNKEEKKTIENVTEIRMFQERDA